MAKAFEVPRDFSRKVPWSGFGAEAQTFNAYTKKRGIAAFFKFLSLYVGTAVPNLRFKRLLKKPLKNPQNFRTDNTTLFWRKLLRLQGTFHEKSLGQGLGRIAPTYNAHTKKHGICRVFLCFITFCGAFYILYGFKNRLI